MENKSNREIRVEFNKFLKENEDQLGKTCINCKSTEFIEYHHVVPIVYGGVTDLQNVVAVCGSCHAKIHGDKLIRSELTKEGIKKAKTRGVVFGRKIKEGADLEKALELYKEGDLSITMIAEITGVGRATICRRVKALNIKRKDK